jgi:hypothetical protein
LLPSTVPMPEPMSVPMPERSCTCGWRGWAVPIDHADGCVVLTTNTTLICRVDGAVVAFHADAGRPRAANALALPYLPCASPGSPITIRNGELRMVTEAGCFVAHLGSATVWCPPLRGSLDAASRGTLHREIEAAAGGGNFGFPRLAGREVALAQALDRLDPTAVRSAVDHLIGFGPGLTPSGDDVLSGALVTLARSCDLARAHQLLQTAVADALTVPARPTTDPGVALLQLALQGECDETVADVLALMTANPAERARRVRRLLAVGATSGADLLVGILLALRVGVGAAMLAAVAIA